jgi:hypothetical protein
MFCPNCGTQNRDTSRFCMKCGTALATITTATPGPAPIPVPRPYASATPNWQPVGWIGLASAALTIIGFFLPWLSISTGSLGGSLGLPFAGGGVSGWSMFFYNITSILPSLFDSRTGGLSGLQYVPGGYAILLILFLLDLILIVLVPIAGVVTAVHSFRLMDSASSADGYAQQRRLRRIRSNAIGGLIPAIGLLLLIQGVLGFSFSGLGGGLSGASLGLNLMGIGFWLSVIGLLVAIFAGPIAAPKQN